MTGRSVVAVHLTESATWARQGGRTIERPSGVIVAAGGLVVGVDRAMAASDEVFEPAPIRFVDDDVLLLGTDAVDVVEVLAEVLADAVVAAGAVTPVDHLVVTCPTGWLTRRRRVLAAAGRRLAREVRVVTIADIAAAVMDPDGANRSGVVLEVGVLASEATATIGGGRVGVDSIGAMDLSVRPEAVAELAEVVHTAHADVPEWIAVVGTLPTGVAGGLADALRRRWGLDVPVCEIPPRTLVGAAFEWGLGQAGQLPRVSGPGDDSEPVPARTSRRWGVVLAAVVTVVVGAALIVVHGSVDDTPTTGNASTDAPVVSDTVIPAPAPTSIAAPAWVSTGRAALEVPPGWHRRGSEGGADRVELVRDDGRPARILLVQKELLPGADLDAVAVTLGDQIEARSDTFGELSRIEFDARPALAYVEVPDHDSRVVWRVFVSDELQVSIGCQALRGEPDSVAQACDAVAGSVMISAR
ncbi:conserved hypothetical protein [Rhodococcus sp. RD6.2]|uniref:type VII secretion-associated protein n=1 Tax=Rhodococcus sp. RD6.2 TaxID=260936 RepID=UPI00063BA7EC|nr:type VII secretion-associated protein [Rhodococcus sp. RD6.2]CRK50491.1 conserved hypothetical protein [Rhodococcus sp. RD6.2]